MELVLTLFEKKSNSTVDQDTLFHWETLLVVTSSNFEDVSFELFSQDIAIDFLAHSSVEELTTKHTHH